MHAQHTIVVFSHLRWDFVYQRPQHVLSRLAPKRRVIFVQEPVYCDREPFWQLSEAENGVLVCTPHTPIRAGGFAEAQVATLIGMLKNLLESQEVYEYVAWLYTPMALPIARALEPLAVVYDCMDELSAFRGAPKSLTEKEEALLEWADIVFTGGPSLYRAKLGKHSNLHCFPSSVDVEHFRSAARLSEPADQSIIPHPRLGYYGVMDERMDLSLLDTLAAARPEWQVVMIGPVAKIDRESLPARPNIHYLGARNYQELPGYLSGWDVCLLPFALNEATRFISPTKTLEYMAAGLPIVSTPITDVEEPYGDVVYIARDACGFIAACEKALSETVTERQRRSTNMRNVLQHTSWDSTAAAMNRLIEDLLQCGSRESGTIDTWRFRFAGNEKADVK